MMEELKNMVEELKTETPIVERLRKEKQDLIVKATKLSNFRGTEEWGKLTLAEQVLLDTQLSVMNTYIEILVNRIILIQEKELEEVCECEHTGECEENNKPKVIKITIEEGE